MNIPLPSGIHLDIRKTGVSGPRIHVPCITEGCKAGLKLCKIGHDALEKT